MNEWVIEIKSYWVGKNDERSDVGVDQTDTEAPDSFVRLLGQIYDAHLSQVSHSHVNLVERYFLLT